MVAGGSETPDYEFSDDPSFEQDKAQLGLAARDFDDHMWSLEDMLLSDPVAWSASLPSNPTLRVAVSDSTPHSPTALRLTFRIEGKIIVRMGVEARGFTPKA